MKPPKLGPTKRRHITAYYQAVDAKQIAWGEPLTIHEGRRTHVVLPINEHDERH